MASSKPADLAKAVTATAGKIDPGDSDAIAEAKQLLASAATLIRAGNAEGAAKALKAASDLIQGETTDGDAEEADWQPLVDELAGHMKDLAAISTSNNMDAAIRARTGRGK